MTAYTSAFVPEGVELTDGEYLVQVEDAGFKAATRGVELALRVLASCNPMALHSLVKASLDYLYTFGNWQEFHLPELWTWYLKKKNDEEGEA